MTDEELREIEARADAASVGPWRTNYELGGQPPDWNGWVWRDDGTWNGYGTELELICGSQTDANATFIAHAREDVPALVAEVRRLRAAFDAIKRDHRECGAIYDPVCERPTSVG